MNELELLAEIEKLGTVDGNHWDRLRPILKELLLLLQTVKKGGKK